MELKNINYLLLVLTVLLLIFAIGRQMGLFYYHFSLPDLIIGAIGFIIGSIVNSLISSIKPKKS